MRKIYGWLALAGLAAALVGCGGAKPNQTYSKTPAAQNPATPAPAAQSPAPSTGTAKKTYTKAPDMQIDPNKQYTATMKTSLGTMTIQLYAKDAPGTVNNFVVLSKDGFYNGTIFHRIIKNFMIQGGDPQGTGVGGPGYTIKDEYPVKMKYELGTVAMARTSQPNSAGSQFFICNSADCGGLNAQPDYVIFGKVTEGLDVLDKLSNVPVGPGADGAMSAPKTPPTIESITITEK